MTLQRNNTETWSQTKHQTASKHDDSTVHPRLPFGLLQDGGHGARIGTEIIIKTIPLAITTIGYF